MKSLLTSLDLLWVILAFLIMGLGLSRRWALWRQKKPAGASGDWRALATSVLAHRAILHRPSVGGSHLVVFWGFALPLMVIILAQIGFNLPHAPAAILSLVQDLAGGLMLVGVLLLLIRRLGRTEADGPSRTLLPMIVLLVILVSGFLAEGARLNLIKPDGFPWPSPIGWIFSLTSPASPVFMQMMIRLHFMAVLFFIAAIPFTFMRHAVASPLNVFYRKQGTIAALRNLPVQDGDLGAETVNDFSWKQMLDAEACVACGRCDEHCPATLSGKPLSPRKIIRKIRDQMEAVSNGQPRTGSSTDALLLEESVSADEMWACTSCMACVAHCPVCAEPLDKIIDMRRFQVMGEARLPSEARPMIRDLELYGDVQGKGAAHRADWAMNRDVSQLSHVPVQDQAGAEILLWVGCAGAFHPRNQESSRAMVKILKAAGIRFTILGKEELCCGDPARRLGDEVLYRKLARANIDRFNQYQVQKIVTLCPHCLHTLKNEYPQLGGRQEVVHATELIAGLIRDRRIALKYPVAEKVTLHDACYLGRYNQVYQPPRDICQAVPGARLKETARNRESGLCCGGGGGRMWLHENIGQNINVLRAEEIAEAGVDLIGTACPYCLVMLDDGVKSLELEKTPKVADIVDIVAHALG